jgi:hypothetical protein
MIQINYSLALYVRFSHIYKNDSSLIIILSIFIYLNIKTNKIRTTIEEIISY